MMKVSVQLSLEIDAEAWSNTFGVTGAANIREDVKQYVLGCVEGNGVFGNGEVPNKIWRAS